MYISPNCENGKVESAFVYFIEMRDVSAQGLFDILKECTTSKNIPLDNIVAYCSDTSNVMMGANHSVATLLKECLMNVVIIKCACHMIHLCTSHAYFKLPKYIEDLCRNILAHFSFNSKRQHSFKEFQKFVEIEPQVKHVGFHCNHASEDF